MTVAVTTNNENGQRSLHRDFSNLRLFSNGPLYAGAFIKSNRR